MLLDDGADYTATDKGTARGACPFPHGVAGRLS